MQVEMHQGQVANKQIQKMKNEFLFRKFYFKTFQVFP